MENRVKADLQTIRSQIHLYKIQHNNQLPPSDRFIQCLLKTTTGDHLICNADKQDSFGPYLLKMPVNDYNNLTTVEIAPDDSGLGDSSHGWHLNTTTGEFNIDFYPPVDLHDSDSKYAQHTERP